MRISYILIFRKLRLCRANQQCDRKIGDLGMCSNVHNIMINVLGTRTDWLSRFLENEMMPQFIAT